MVFGQILEIVSCFVTSHFDILSSPVLLLTLSIRLIHFGSHSCYSAFTSTLFSLSLVLMLRLSLSHPVLSIPSQLFCRGSVSSS